MAVQDGQRVRALETNAALASKTVNNTFLGVQTLDHPTSGGTISNVQQKLNDVDALAAQIPQIITDVNDLDNRVDAVELETTSLRTLSGTAVADDALGTFTGTTIPDDSTIKEALQELETSVEAKIPLSQKGAANGVAELDAGGKVPSSQLPAIAITDVFLVADIPARDALTVESGDVAIVADDGSGDPNTYIYDGTVWQELQIPSGGVATVNGQTGTVVLDLDDINDVVLTALADKDYLVWDGTQWVNRKLKSIQTDAVSTGANATLPTITGSLVRVTNASLTSVDMVPAGFEGQDFILVNRTGATVSINNETGAIASQRIFTGTNDTLDLENNAALWLTYDTTTSRWQITGGSGGGLVAHQETLGGTVNGVNTTFGPLTYNPKTDLSIMVFIDGLALQESEWAYTAPNIVLTTPPIAGQSVYVYYLRSGTTSPAPVISNVWKTEYRILTGGEITAKELSLAQTPASVTEVLLDVISGGPQFYGDDFTVSGTTLSWNGLGLDGILQSGDKVRIGYVY